MKSIGYKKLRLLFREAQGNSDVKTLLFIRCGLRRLFGFLRGKDIGVCGHGFPCQKVHSLRERKVILVAERIA